MTKKKIKIKMKNKNKNSKIRKKKTFLINCLALHLPWQLGNFGNTPREGSKRGVYWFSSHCVWCVLVWISGTIATSDMKFGMGLCQCLRQLALICNWDCELGNPLNCKKYQVERLLNCKLHRNWDCLSLPQPFSFSLLRFKIWENAVNQNRPRRDADEGSRLNSYSGLHGTYYLAGLQLAKSHCTFPKRFDELEGLRLCKVCT